MPVAKKKKAVPKVAGRPVIARVFRNGRSDAVRIPATMKLNCTEVELVRTEDGILMRPRRTLTPKEFSAKLDEIRKMLPADFEFERPPQGEYEKREPLFD